MRGWISKLMKKWEYGKVNYTNRLIYQWITKETFNIKTNPRIKVDSWNGSQR